MSAMLHVGIDFGTTNSAVAVGTDDAPPTLIEFPGLAGAAEPLWRTVLYFDPTVEPGDDPVSAGGPAIERYIENDGDGRLLQSIKSFLASSKFQRVQILGRQYSLPELIAAFLRQVRARAGADLGRRAVVGRPVRYWGAETDDDDILAITRMREALAMAGFDEVVFELEPVAAAANYAARLDRDELVLIADFGGGTSDFSLLRVGPQLTGDADSILATGGIGIGGDTFDARIIDRVISPALGKGSQFRDAFGHEAPVPTWLYTRLRRWHHLSFLKSKKTMELLDRVLTGAVQREPITMLVQIIEHELGLPLHQAVERAKVALSAADDAVLSFVRPGIGLGAAIERSAFDGWIADELASIDQVVDGVLADAGVEAGAVDRVFATGGSSFVPAIQALLARRFGADKLVGGDELNSVALGLARRARSILGG